MLPVYSYDQIAHQLTDVGQVYFGDTRQNFNVRTGDRSVMICQRWTTRDASLHAQHWIFGRSIQGYALRQPRLRLILCSIMGHPHAMPLL